MAGVSMNLVLHYYDDIAADPDVHKIIEVMWKYSNWKNFGWEHWNEVYDHLKDLDLKTGTFTKNTANNNNNSENPSMETSSQAKTQYEYQDLSSDPEYRYMVRSSDNMVFRIPKNLIILNALYPEGNIMMGIMKLRKWLTAIYVDNKSITQEFWIEMWDRVSQWVMIVSILEEKYIAITPNIGNQKSKSRKYLVGLLRVLERTCPDSVIIRPLNREGLENIRKGLPPIQNEDPKLYSSYFYAASFYASKETEEKKQSSKDINNADQEHASVSSDTATARLPLQNFLNSAENVRDSLQKQVEIPKQIISYIEKLNDSNHE